MNEPKRRKPYEIFRRSKKGTSWIPVCRAFRLDEAKEIAQGSLGPTCPTKVLFMEKDLLMFHLEGSKVIQTILTGAPNGN